MHIFLHVKSQKNFVLKSGAKCTIEKRETLFLKTKIFDFWTLGGGGECFFHFLIRLINAKSMQIFFD